MARKVLNSELLLKICFVIVALLIIWSVYDYVKVDAYQTDIAYRTVYVSQGETVWSIAAKHVGKNEDIRDMITAIKCVNNLSNDVSIYPGQALRVPYKQTGDTVKVAKASVK